MPTELTQPAEVLSSEAGRPLRWWTQAKLQRINEVVRAGLTDWCNDWGLSLSRVQTVNAEGLCPPGHAVGVGGAALWSTANGEDAMHRLLFDEAPGLHAAARSMAQEVAAMAWVSWSGALAQIFPVAQPGVSEAGVAGARGYWSGALLISLELGARSGTYEFKIQVQAPSAVQFADHFEQTRATQAAQPGEPALLQGIEAALADRHLKLTVQLAAVELDLGSLQSLQLDDVIALPHSLGQPLEVRLSAPDVLDDAAATLCWAHLGRQGGHKAVEVVRKPNIQST